jgi:hypothetical protein
MAITVSRLDDAYEASVTLPHGTPWNSPNTMSALAIVAKLRELGCHTTDIDEAFQAADPRWKERLRGPTDRP